MRFVEACLVLAVTANSLAALPTNLCADAIVVTKAMSASTIAEVFVEDNQILIELEIGGADIEAFKNLLSDEIGNQIGLEDLGTYEQRLQQFFSKDMVVRSDGRPLVGEVIQLIAKQRIRRDEITGQPLLLQPEKAELVIYAKLKYPLVGQPQTFSIGPTLEPVSERVSANIGFMTYHRGLPVMDFRYLSTVETLDLDWHDPWYSRFRNQNLRRQFDAPLSTFLYVEQFEVRLEVVARPADLQRWTELGITSDQIIPVAKQRELKTQAAEFLADKINVMIDGETAQGGCDRIHFIRRSLRKTGVIYPDEDLHASAATLGIIFVYPVEHLPENVTMKWELFDDKIDQVPAIATDEAGGLPSTLTVDSPILQWKNFLTHPTVPAMLAIDPPPSPPRITVPMVSLGLFGLAGLALIKLLHSKGKKSPVMCAALVVSVVGTILCFPLAQKQFVRPFASATRLPDDDAKDVTQSLLHNLYRSFDRKQESIVYDQLATCVSGEFLREIYLQVMHSIRLEDQGGAQVNIDDIEIVGNVITHSKETGFQSEVRWNVFGKVGHWGHLHTRANQYQADLKIEPVNGVWKIVNMQVNDEMQVESSPAR